MGTRGKATIEDIQPGSIYQDGPAWLKQPEEKWPLKTAQEVRSNIPSCDSKYFFAAGVKEKSLWEDKEDYSHSSESLQQIFVKNGAKKS